MATVWQPYAPMGAPSSLEIVDSFGSNLLLADGRRLIDAIGSWWCAIHGYRPAPILQAMQARMETVPHIMLAGLHHGSTQACADALTAIAPGNMSHVFFSESGSIAVEVALKMALQYFWNQGQLQKKKFVYFDGGYHGDTFMMMSMCDPEDGMHARFTEYMPQQLVHAVPKTEQGRYDFEKLCANHADTIAGVIIEPRIQGAGGMRLHSPDVLQHIRSVCSKYDILMIADEIFTGFGRTGKFFACETANIVPDIMTCGKGLTGGVMPLAATLCTPTVFKPFDNDDPSRALMHGPTFMGNPLGCSAALANIEWMLTMEWQANVKAVEKHLLETLSAATKHSKVEAIQVLGAMGAITLKKEPKSWAPVKDFAISRGIWMRPFGRILYTTPAFNISPDALNQITDCMLASLDLIE